MTDHSILFHTADDLPFSSEARFVTNLYNFFTKSTPSAFDLAVQSRDLFEELSDLNTAQLAELGIDRTEIAGYTAKKTGLLAL